MGTATRAYRLHLGKDAWGLPILISRCRLRLVGTRFRAIRRRTSKESANGKTGEAIGKEPQLRERKSAFAEAAKRSVEAAAPDGRERIPIGAGGATIRTDASVYFSRWPKPINLCYDILIFLFN
jgi:hypothetical protein